MRIALLMVLAAVLVVASILVISAVRDDPNCDQGGGVVRAHCEAS